MIVPNKNYRYEVTYDSVSNRWKARFHSEKPEGISFAFPLPDVAWGSNVPRPILTPAEEYLLALTFQQMVTSALQDMAAQQRVLQAPVSATEAELTN